MRVLRAVLVLTLVGLVVTGVRARRDAAGPPAVHVAEAVTDTSAVLAALDRYYADLTARDWQALSTHFWPDATLTTVWQVPGEPAPRVTTFTVADYVRQAPHGPGSRSIFEERMTGSRIRLHSNLAAAWVTYDARFGDPGDVVCWSGIDAFTLIRHDDAWRIASLAWTADDAGPMGANACG